MAADPAPGKYGEYRVREIKNLERKDLFTRLMQVNASVYRANSHAALIQKSVDAKMHDGLSEQMLRSIWRALGSYVAK